MKIDRKFLVERHNIYLSKPDFSSPLTVGNGEFAFTADITGLQTFRGDYKQVPLCTMSQWGWHSNLCDMDESKLKLTNFDTYGREVGYATKSISQEELYDNLRQNPHRMNLANIGFSIGEEDLTLQNISLIKQTLDLWNGRIESSFCLFDEKADVVTCVDPDDDVLGVTVSCALLRNANLVVRIRFPYATHHKDPSLWTCNSANRSVLLNYTEGRALVKRVVDNDIYYVDFALGENVIFKQTADNEFVICSIASGKLSFTARFSKTHSIQKLTAFDEIYRKCKLHWNGFWLNGGALQLIDSSDARAFELERRIVLSQYLTAVQCSGSVPPAETGLTCNSWYGKFHLEMHYWHAAHFPLWGRTDMLLRSLSWYRQILPIAREIAESQGYKGARWPKMTDVSGRNSPSWIAVLLLWQQPHPILMAELCFRAIQSQELLCDFSDVVEESAKFIADFVHYNKSSKIFEIGPPIIPAQETHDPRVVLNPTFELEYCRWALETANKWRYRLGKHTDDKLLHVSQRLAPLPRMNDVYLAHERCEETFSKEPFFSDHPSMVAAFGVLPGKSVDQNIMRNTVYKILDSWDFDSMWGWDFGMLAMTCAKLGLPELAIDMLMIESPKNTYVKSGHNAQGEREDLPLYLPGNGSLLIATAMMAAGWDGDNNNYSPGFPVNGCFKVEHEGLNKYI